MFDPSRGKTKTGSSSNKKRSTGSRSSSITHNTAIYDSQSVNLSGNVCIKKPGRSNDLVFVVPFPEKIPENLRARYEKFKAPTEPVIKVRHCITPSI